MNSEIRHTRTEKLLLEAARTFNSTVDYEELIKLVLELVMKAVGGQAALLFRVDHRRSDMKCRLLKSGESTVRTFHRELGQGVVGWVARHREPVIINDPANDERFDPEIGINGDIEVKCLITVPLIGKGQMIGVIEAINREERPFDESDLDILTGLSNQIAVAVDNANLYRQLKREVLQKDLLYETGKKLSGSMELDEVLKELLASLKKVVDYDAAGVFLIDPDNGDVDVISHVGYDQGAEKNLHLKLGQGLVGYVARSGVPIIVSDVEKDQRYVECRMDTKSEMVVPILLDEKVIGALNLESSRRNAYDDDETALLTAIASQAAISIDRARLLKQTLQSQKIVEQLSIAREIQASFLPRKDPEVEGYDICGCNIPSEEVGGDYYDFIPIVKGQIGIAIGDVSGKGIPAALIMASFRASMIAEIRNNYSIRIICQKVNDLLYESTSFDNFVSAVYGVLDYRNHIFTFANCGHNLPVLISIDGSIDYLAEGGPVLGVTQNAVYEERPIVIKEGAIAFFYTDGVSEVFDVKGEEYGLERLIELIKANRELPAVEIQEVIHREVIAFAAPDHLFDDFTTIVLKRLPSGR